MNIPIPPKFLIVFLFTCISSAQAVPDAGVLGQQLEQGRERKQAGTKSTPEKDKPLSEINIDSAAGAAMPAQAGSPSVVVKAFLFTGNSKLTSGQLAPVVASYLNRQITLAELQQAALAVANVYREAGWVVRTLLPPQDIVDGKVTIQVVEAVFGEIRVEGDPGKRVQLARVKRGFEVHQDKAAPINTTILDRQLLLADDLPGVAVSGTLREGAQAGETDLVLKLADEPIVEGEVSLDNFGARSTGANRASGNINVNSPFHIGDLFSTNIIHTEGSDYVRAAYSIPLGGDGWRVGASATSFAYKLVTPEFASLNSKGSSVTMGVDMLYPLIRSRLHNLYFTANYDNKQLDNQSSDSTQSNYQVDNLSIGLNGNVFDRLLGGGANSASLVFTSGHVSLGKLDSGESNALKRDFSKLRYTASRQQFITDNLSLLMMIVGQESGHTDLDSSEKFYLGGANGVRAYPSSEGGGSSGAIGNIELRWRLPHGFIATTFYDYGQVSNFDNTASYTLKGAGMSLAWQARFGLNLKATWARRIGGNPNPTTAGNDQDGSFVMDRLWLIASIPFAFGEGGASKSLATTNRETAALERGAVTGETRPSVFDDTQSGQEATGGAATSASAVANATYDSNAGKQASGTVAKAVRAYREKPLVAERMQLNSAQLTPQMKLMLDDFAQEAVASPTEGVEVSGHTDISGDARFNMLLSQKRASAAQKYLVKRGIAASRITTQGYGAERPIASNATKQGRQQNRRVEVKLIPQ